MTEFPRFGTAAALAAFAELRRIDIDQLSTVRYIHASALRLQAAHMLSEDEIAAFTAHVYTSVYAEALLRQTLVGAFVDGELVGTAGWTVADDSGSGVRVRSVYVRPLFTGMGVGTRLLEAVEQDACTAGFRSFSVRSTLNATSFFEQNGYLVTSHGVRQLFGNHHLPVAFMRKSAPAMS
jgi:GNAT superfamily N-acetyltransferase